VKVTKSEKKGRRVTSLGLYDKGRVLSSERGEIKKKKRGNSPN